MSKKSRRRNRKILGLLAAGLGAAAIARGRGTAQGVSGADKAKFTSDAAYTAPVTGVEYPGENKVVAAPVKTPITDNRFRTRHRITDSAGNTIPNIKKQAYVAAHKAPKNVMGPFGYMQPTTSTAAVPRGRFWTKQFKSGGRVGVGKAKRGFGRALKKGRK